MGARDRPRMAKSALAKFEGDPREAVERPARRKRRDRAATTVSKLNLMIDTLNAPQQQQLKLTRVPPRAHVYLVWRALEDGTEVVAKVCGSNATALEKVIETGGRVQRRRVWP